MRRQRLNWPELDHVIHTVATRVDIQKPAVSDGVGERYAEGVAVRFVVHVDVEVVELGKRSIPPRTANGRHDDQRLERREGEHEVDNVGKELMIDHAVAVRGCRET